MDEEYRRIWDDAYRQGQEQRARQEAVSAGIGTGMLQQIPNHLLVDFPPGPYNRYKLHQGRQRQELLESIRSRGILEPLIVRPQPDGTYQIVSGKNRRSIAVELGYETLPCIVRELDDEEALLQLNIINVRQRRILPSERAFAYRLELETWGKQGARRDLTSRQFVGKLETAAVIGKQKEQSGRQIQRYIRLTELVEELLAAVDQELLALGAAVELSYLPRQDQRTVADYFFECSAGRLQQRAGRRIGIRGAKELRRLQAAGTAIDALTIGAATENKSGRYRLLRLNMVELRAQYPELQGLPEQDAAQLVRNALARYLASDKSAL